MEIIIITLALIIIVLSVVSFVLWKEYRKGVRDEVKEEEPSYDRKIQVVRFINPDEVADKDAYDFISVDEIVSHLYKADFTSIKAYLTERKDVRGFLVNTVAVVSGKKMSDLSGLSKAFKNIQKFINIDDPDAIKDDKMFPNGSSFKFLKKYKEDNPEKWNIIWGIYVDFLHDNSIIKRISDAEEGVFINGADTYISENHDVLSKFLSELGVFLDKKESILTEDYAVVISKSEKIKLRPIGL